MSKVQPSWGGPSVILMIYHCPNTSRDHYNASKRLNSPMKWAKTMVLTMKRLAALGRFNGQHRREEMNASLL